jgi:hypothetical protein
MRSGDIMQYDTDSGLDPQPPCNFYTKVLEEGNNGTAFKHALIVTQPDFRNPCISLVHKRFPKLVTVQSHSINEDACMIATAQNVATAAYSTWDVALTRLNVNLKNLYVPMGKDDGTDYYIGSIWGVWQNSDYPKWIVNEEGMRHAQHVYSFPGYQTSWNNWNERVGRMTRYPRDLIISRTISATTSTSSTTTATTGHHAKVAPINDNGAAAHGHHESSTEVAPINNGAVAHGHHESSTEVAPINNSAVAHGHHESSTELVPMNTGAVAHGHHDSPTRVTVINNGSVAHGHHESSTVVTPVVMK